MVYLDTSVMLAHLYAEDVAPPEELWGESLVASRLAEYEVFSRLNAGGRMATHGEAARELFTRVALLEMIEPVIGRAAQPLPIPPGTPLRTLDALHLASMLFLKEQGVDLRLASYDQRLTAGAAEVGIEAYPL